MFQKSNNPPHNIQEPPELALDGVRYSLLATPAGKWRLGSLSPHWREELPLLGDNPGKEKLEELSKKNIFLNKDDSPRLCVMCCGLGSAWPGMGRELYDNFPAARAAMDSLAAYVDWDILSIMDETDPERLNHSRIQIPYLFMLEYAQWNQLVSLGLQPDLICGHSLGELIALSLSGTLPLATAWHLFETRSSHMALLEENSADKSGMLTVSANHEVIKEALRDYPKLYISNCNTPKQYILSGPRDQLLKLRKNLRRAHIPAFMLGINLAFHNPGMRVLRDLSLRRLNGLEMRAPQIPLLSCITAGPYPQSQTEICEYIADLDENTVDWPKSVSAIKNNYNIHHFLELGPQETLCGLVSENYPGSHCFSTSRRGHEVEAMRSLCARLYSLGLLKDRNIRRLANRKPVGHSDFELKEIDKKTPSRAPLQSKAPEWNIVMELLAEETGRPLDEIVPELDLRYDLALRSSRFPYIVQEAERRLNRQIALENLLQISTVGDLANFLTGETVSPQTQSTSPTLPFERSSPFIRSPLAAYKLSPQGLKPWRPDPDKFGLFRGNTEPIALCALDKDLLPWIWSGMAPLGLKLLLPSFLLDECASLKKYGNELLPLDLTANATPEIILEALSKADASFGPVQGILYILPTNTTQAPHENSIKKFLSIIPNIKTVCPYNWLCCLNRYIWPPANEINHGLEQAKNFFFLLRSYVSDTNVHGIFWLDERSNPNLQNQTEAGDMLARELLYSAPEEIVWISAKFDPSLTQSPLYCPSAECMEVMQSQTESKPKLGRFMGEGQFSSFKDPALTTHGANPDRNEAILPLGYILKSILTASKLAIPWLEPFAISDVEIDAFPIIPYGIVREYRVEAQTLQWLPQEKSLSRLCRTLMTMRELQPNGRPTQTWFPVCKALCSLFLPKNDMPLYHKLISPNIEYDQTPNKFLENYYGSINLGKEWKFIKSLERPKDESLNSSRLFYQARVTSPAACVAGYSEWEYNAFAFLIQAVYQALTMALVPSEKILDIPETLERWRCKRIGYMRFLDSLDKYAGDLIIHYHRSWIDARFTRFDGMIETETGKTILSFLHFEFDKTEIN